VSVFWYFLLAVAMLIGVMLAVPGKDAPPPPPAQAAPP
jgi:hypothetical protein